MEPEGLLSSSQKPTTEPAESSSPHRFLAPPPTYVYVLPVGSSLRIFRTKPL